MTDRMATFYLEIDYRFPPCPDSGPVWKAVFENGSTFARWYTWGNFQDWLKAHEGSIRSDEHNKRYVVCARLTAKQLKEAQWGKV